MTTIAAVMKGDVSAIAADTLSTAGSRMVPPELQTRPTKIVRVGKSFVGSAGSLATVRVLESLSRRHKKAFNLHSVDEIFETFRVLHKVLVDEYHLMTKEDDDEQPYESSQTNLMIVNSSGIYEVQGYREVTEFKKFWAIGSGDEYALGALEALYADRRLGARNLANKAVEVACTFDNGSGRPVECRSNRVGKA